MYVLNTTDYSNAISNITEYINGENDDKNIVLELLLSSISGGVLLN